MKSWLFMATLFVLCAVLGVLQYQWVGEFSRAEGERRRTALERNLAQLSQDFHGEIGSAFRDLAPFGADDVAEARGMIEARFPAVKSGHAGRIFRRIGVATPQGAGTSLELLDKSTGKFLRAEWPPEWQEMRERFAARLEGMPMPPMADGDGLLFETPLFAPGPPPEGRHGPGRGFGKRENGWVLFELDPDGIRDAVLPEVVERHLDTNEYDVEVVRPRASTAVWASSANAKGIAECADASIGLMEMRLSPFMEPGRGGRGGRGRGPGGPPGAGRWTLYARHRAGSLEAMVERTRWKNLGVTGGVLLLLVATIGALWQFTRNAQRLAHMQMDFVAGVSHELRTPLTAIYTAGHNLRGRIAHNPSQVERYGEMIQQESGRLRELVEQVLRFASANAGRVIQARTPVAARSLIEQTVEASRCAMQAAHCTVEQKIDDPLPEILADPLALKQALQNLLANAVKYGATDEPWIGIAASRTEGPRGPAVEIRVADRGPGIPVDEQKHIFDAFYRGRRAVQDQIHGAGLGLNLVKKIVEAHGGSIRVKSAPGEGAEFIVEIPAVREGEAA